MKRQVETIKLDSVIANYLDTIKMSRSVLVEQWLDPKTTPAEKLTEDVLSHFSVYLKNFSPATERLYLQAVVGFYRYVSAERLADINLPRMDLLIKQRKRKVGIRLPQFPANDIESVLAFVKDAGSLVPAMRGKADLNVRLRAMRDRAFLLTLADTGLRVHEACKLRRGDLDWNEGRAIIIGKGDKQAVVRFSTRSIKALKDYLSLRTALDGDTGKQLTALPLFARHDKGAGKKIKPMTTTTGRNIVTERVRQILGENAVGKITPHSFRHYFVTTVLRGSGNLKLAQELARHANIQVTQRYAHLNDDELDKGYYEIFEEGKE
jgi:integrase/recombinase XerC